jgi:hypothetical protein
VKPEYMEKHTDMWKPEYMEKHTDMWKPEYMEKHTDMWKPKYMEKHTDMWKPEHRKILEHQLVRHVIIKNNSILSISVKEVLLTLIIYTYEWSFNWY